MYRQLLTILLLGSMLMQSMQSLVIVMDYHYNKGLFERNCINKNTPALQCHGQCQMSKKLKAEQQREADSNLRKFSTEVFTPFTIHISAPEPIATCGLSTFPNRVCSMDVIDITCDLLRPPIGC